MDRISIVILSMFWCLISNAQIIETFSDGNFTSNPTWATSSVSDFSVAVGQLKSANTTSNTSFYISTTNTITSNCTWEFWVNLQFATSAANYVDAYLISDNSNLLASTINGYFVRIGNTSDDISLYKSTVGTQTVIIDGVNSTVASSTNNLIKIKVTRTSANLFTLERDMTGTGSSYVSEGNITDATFNTSSSFGFVVKQSTASFFGKHIFDDITVGTIVIDTTPPSVVKDTVISSTQLDILFNEPVEITSAQTIANYSVNNGIGNPNTVIRDATNLSLVHLSFVTAFPDGLNNTVTITGVKDLSLNAISSATATFTYIAPVTIGYRDIIINEIYADPSPLVNLTVTEFIELYNRSSNAFNLNGLKFTDGSSTSTLSNYTLSPNSYVIICPIADTAQFTALGYMNKLGVGSFPSLNNANDNLYIKTSIGVFIDSVNYSDTWYKDAVKKAGGWTLEQINPNQNLSCSQASNWIDSNDNDGGTPGFINSVYSTLPDIIPPTIDTIKIIDSHHIMVCFDDVISASQLTTSSSYTISGAIGTPTLSSVVSGNMCVTLSLSADLINATTYTIIISGITDCNGNSLSQNSAVFTYTSDVIPPSIISNSVISNNQLDVLFSEPLEITSAQNTTNYLVNNSIGNPTNVVRDAINKALVHLTFTNVFTNAMLNTLTVSNVKDTVLNTITTATTNFIYYTPAFAGYKDIIINEIFADPSPVVNLTNTEFIELYNRSATNTYNLSGFHVASSYTTIGATLSNYNLLPNSYVIICPISDTAQFTALGYINKLVVSSFPSLNNSGTHIYLKTTSSILIDSVTYSDSWYQDAVKKAGGYTLELINPNVNTTCFQASNWIGSNNINGGTPGFVNSVYSIAPDIIAPKISSVNVIDSLHISICFDDVISSSQLSVATNYSVNNGINAPSNATIISDNKCVMLTLSNKLINATNYTITINGITDCNGNPLTPNTKQFSYYKAKPYDVVINELMPDPDPSISLPNVEYVELKNITNFSISLKNWKISSPTSSKKLPDITIAPNGYIVLVGSGTANQYLSNFGIVVYEVPSFPSLSNSGSTITLRDTSNTVMSTVSYSLSWYNDVNKSDGGWSLEQIDANNPCGGQINWRASTNPNGGTPALPNSVAASNPDNNSPIVDRVIVITADTISLLFNEPLDSITLSNPLNYTFDNGLITPTYVKAIAPDFKKVILKLSSAIQVGTIYNVSVLNGITDCVGNQLINGTLPFALPEAALPNDVVINEILFDPATGGVDFVELYNRSNKTINLKDLRIGSMDTLTETLIDTKIITNDGFLLFPQSYVVISENGNSIKQHYLTPNPKGFLDIADLPSMNSDDDVVTLSDANYTVIDNFKYTVKMHFPLLVSTKGVSLERIDFNRPTNDKTNWNSAAENVGFATPAYRNSQYLQADGGSGVSIPNPLFSPDNDGYNDVLNISYKLDEPGKAANVYIYDSKGRQVRYLIRNEQLAQDGTLSWNGINDDNEKAPIGIYVVYVELFNLSGKVNKYKLSCTLAGKL